MMGVIKCSECEYCRVSYMPRHGNGNSACRGSFSQQAYVCNHPKPDLRQPLIFYGKTSPKLCPRKIRRDSSGM